MTLIGICIVVNMAEDFPSIITYTLRTYELALAQAIELQKGVDLSNMVETNNINPSDGRRSATFLYPDHGEIVAVQECELGESILPVATSGTRH